MTVDGIEVRKIRNGENSECVGPVPGSGVVYFDNNPLCATCFGQKVLEGEHGSAVLGYLLSKLLDA